MEELIFRTKVETGKSVTETDKLTKSLEEVGVEAKDAGAKGAEALAKLNKKVEEGGYSIREATKLVKEYGSIALQAGRESPIGQEAIRLAGELSDTIGDLRTEITNAGTDGANLKAGLELAGTVTAGYGALQGVIALTGSENEALAETFVKLTAVQSVLTGIEQVRASLEKESLLMTKGKVVWTKVATAAEYVYALAVGSTTGAMKVLRIAMMALPIVLIIAGIVALVSALSAFMAEEKKVEEQNKALNESLAKQSEELDANTRAFQRNADNKRALMVSANASAEELFEFDKKRLFGEEILRKKNLNMYHKALVEKRTLSLLAIKEGRRELAESIEEELTQIHEKYAGLKELDGQYLVDKKLLENKYKSDIAKQTEDENKEQDRKNTEWAKKAKDRRDAEAQKRLEQQRLLEDLLALNIEDANARRIAQMKLQHERELAEVRTKYGTQSEVASEMETKQANEKKALLDEISKQEQEAKNAQTLKAQQEAQTALEKENRDKKAMLEGKLIAMREDWDAEQELKRELAQLEMEQALQQVDLTEGEKYKIKEEYLQKLDALDEENATKEKERNSQVAEAAKKVLTMGLEAAQGLADAFFDYKIQKAGKGTAEELRLEKKKFEVNKKLQIAQAIMQGIQATMAAYSSGFAIPIVGAVAGPAFAAVAGITSALNVAKIKGTTFEGGGSVSTPSTSAPSVDVTSIQGQDSGVTTQTQGLQGSQSNDIKVVLLDSELKASLNENAQVSVVSSVG